MGRAADRTYSLSRFRPVRPSINKSPPCIWGASSCRHCSGGDARETLLIPTWGTSSCIQELQTSNTTSRVETARSWKWSLGVLISFKWWNGRRENNVMVRYYDENNNTKRNDQLPDPDLHAAFSISSTAWLNAHRMVSSLILILTPHSSR